MSVLWRRKNAAPWKSEPFLGRFPKVFETCSWNKAGRYEDLRKEMPPANTPSPGLPSTPSSFPKLWNPITIIITPWVHRSRSLRFLCEPIFPPFRNTCISLKRPGRRSNTGCFFERWDHAKISSNHFSQPPRTSWSTTKDNRKTDLGKNLASLNPHSFRTWRNKTECTSFMRPLVRMRFATLTSADYILSLRLVLFLSQP